MKAVLSNRIFLEVSPELATKLKEELTYKIPSFHDPETPIVIRNYGVIRAGLMSIPIGRIDLIPSDYEIVDKRVLLPADYPEFRFPLRDSQQAVYDNLEDNAIINAKPSWGKAQPSYSAIRVPDGWTTMGEIKVGDIVVTPSNKTSKVVGKFEHKNKPIYEVTFIDGRVTHACSEHLWEVYVNREKSTRILTTEELLQHSRLLKEKRLYVPLPEPISDEERPHIIDPYVLGFLLGDGGLTNTVSFSTADPEIVQYIRDSLPEDHSITHLNNYDYRIVSPTGKINVFLEELRRLKLLGHKSNTKFIPKEYMYDSLKNKIKLVQGLLDSDGTIETSGKIEFCSTSKQLMDDFTSIIRSLGGTAVVSQRVTSYTYKGEKKNGLISYRCRPTRLTTAIKKQLFRLDRKAKRIRIGKLDNFGRLGIKSIELLGPDDCFCIALDSADKLYLTDDYIVTHNTFAGLAIAGKLAQKTLVVVHTVPLRTQWAKEVKKVYGIEAGVIGSGKMNLNSPIVIGNVQSLYNCVDKIQKSFGTVILDEMHHVSSPTFHRVMDKMYSRYKIGLSGTLNRKDGKHVVFRDYFSSNIFKPPPENSMAPEIHVYSPGIHLPEDSGWALRVNALMNLPEYRAVVLAIADKYTRLGHNNLIVADRVEFLEYCASKREKGIAIVGNTENREEALESVGVTRNEVWGTTSIFKEGISHNILSALILATPINNEPMLEQLIGRVQRIVPGKLNPIVVDIKLEGHTGYNQFQQRLGHYMRMGYKVRYM